MVVTMAAAEIPRGDSLERVCLSLPAIRPIFDLDGGESLRRHAERTFVRSFVRSFVCALGPVRPDFPERRAASNHRRRRRRRQPLVSSLKQHPGSRGVV